MKKTILTTLLCVIHIYFFAQYTIGEKVLIEYQGQWYNGKIIEEKTTGYYISYDDYDASWNEIVKTDRLKKINENSSTQPASSNSSTKPVVSDGNIAQQKAKEMCDCLNKMVKTQKQEDKSRCLNMQEEHVAQLIKGSANYTSYKKQVSECEQQIAATKNPTNTKATTYEEKVKAVCDCFKDANAGKVEKFNCFKLQSDYGKTVGDKKTDFNIATNSCGN